MSQNIILLYQKELKLEGIRNNYSNGISKKGRFGKSSSKLAGALNCVRISSKILGAVFSCILTYLQVLTKGCIPL